MAEAWAAVGAEAFPLLAFELDAPKPSEDSRSDAADSVAELAEAEEEDPAGLLELPHEAVPEAARL